MASDRPAFIDPHTEWVECYICGRHIEDFSRVEGLDISADDEYYPTMVPVCRDGNHRETRADGGSRDSETRRDPLDVIDERIDYLKSYTPRDQSHRASLDSRVQELQIVRQRIMGGADE